MLRIVKNRVYIASFRYLTQVHNRHFVGYLRDHTQIMGNQHDAHAELGLQLHQQFQNLSLGGDIHGRCWLVGDQQSGIAGEGHSDHGALAHASAQLEGVAVEVLGRPGDAHPAEELHGALTSFLGSQGEMEPNNLRNLIADAMDRAERGHGFLEYHGNVFAADIPHRPATRIEGGEIDDLGAAAAVLGELAVEENFSRHDTTRLVNDLENGFGGDALAAATLADNTERTVAVYFQVHSVYRFDDALIQDEMGFEVFDFD